MLRSFFSNVYIIKAQDTFQAFFRRKDTFLFLFSPWGFSCQKTLYTVSWKWTQMEYFSLQNFCHFLSAHVTGKVRCWIDISTIPLHCFGISYMSKSFLNCQMEVTFPKKVAKPYCNFRWISDIAFCKGISVHWFFFRFLIF